jgi:hypothetical protein
MDREERIFRSSSTRAMVVIAASAPLGSENLVDDIYRLTPYPPPSFPLVTYAAPTQLSLSAAMVWRGKR